VSTAPQATRRRAWRPRLALPAAGPGARLTLAAALWLVVGVTCTTMWWLAGSAGNWPLWVWFGAALPVAIAGALRLAWRAGPGRVRWTTAHAGLAVVTSAALVYVWALTGRGDWLAWALLGIGVAFVVHALLAFADQLPPRPREQRLSARVNALERSRTSALQLRSDELRRVERDLHDGVQSRLVALSMLLARAEERVGADHAALELLQEARTRANEAVDEVRHVARGLAPPLLAERGLATAVEGLALRIPSHVDVDIRLEGAAPAAAEETAYFVVAEALANVCKHAPGAAARVSLRHAGGRLLVEVRDDGPGGADARGSGLAGLRQRVEAVDGSLTVERGEPRGTLLRAELPCGS
jgi:signal transduction histidine kinase